MQDKSYGQMELVMSVDHFKEGLTSTLVQVTAMKTKQFLLKEHAHNVKCTPNLKRMDQNALQMNALLTR